MNKKLLFTVLGVAVMAMTGCGSSEAVQTPATTTEVTTSESANEEAGTVHVVHTLGETDVPKNPQNVVVLELGILDALSSLDVEVTGLPLSSALPTYLSDYADEAKYTNVGSLKELDMEKIFEIEPELIIIGGRQADYYDELSKIAPTIQIAVESSDYLNSFETNMNYVGEIFGKEEEVEAKLEAVKADIAALQAKATEMDVNGLITLANGDAFSVYGEGSRFGVIHNDFGIKAVDQSIESSTHGQNASFEYIVEQNPDYLFVVDRTAATGGEGSAPALFDNELIKTTDAYKNDRIVYLNPNVWYTAGGGFTSTEIMIEEISAALEK